MAEDDLFSGLSELLGETVRTRHDLVELSFRGAHPRAVKSLTEASSGVIEVSWIISPRTLSHRLSKGQNLTPTETGNVIRFAKILLHAFQVFGGHEKALGWLNRVHPALHPQLSTLELCRTEEGALLVAEWLVAMDHGFAT